MFESLEFISMLTQLAIVEDAKAKDRLDDFRSTTTIKSAMMMIISGNNNAIYQYAEI